MRLFIAIELPADVKRELGGLKVDIPGVRWVPTDKIHLTLAFLGEVDGAALERLTGELARIQVTEFRLCFSGTGCFPDRRRPRVLWIGLVPHPRLHHTRRRESVKPCWPAASPRRSVPSPRISPWPGSSCHPPGSVMPFSISTKS